MRIRVATADDADDVARIIEEVYVGGGWADPQRSPDYVAELLHVRTRIAEATVLVAEDVDRLIATITATTYPSHLANIARPGELEIRILGVLRAGVGDALTQPD